MMERSGPAKTSTRGRFFHGQVAVGSVVRGPACLGRHRKPCPELGQTGGELNDERGPILGRGVRDQPIQFYQHGDATRLPFRHVPAWMPRLVDRLRREYAQGDVRAEERERLELLLTNAWQPVFSHGVHTCEFCRERSRLRVIVSLHTIVGIRREPCQELGASSVTRSGMAGDPLDAKQPRREDRKRIEGHNLGAAK